MPAFVPRPDRQPSFRLELDPAASAQAKAVRDRRFQTRILPRTRIAAFALFGILLGFHEWALGEARWLATGAFFVAAEAYAVATAILLRRFYGRTGRLHLGDLFLHLDMIVGGALVVLTGGEQSLLFALLFLRVADQSYISSRRCGHFLHVATLATLVSFVVTGWVEGRPVDWQRASAGLVLCYGAGLYVVLTASMFSSVRHKLSAAVHTAREAVRSESERRVELERALAETEEANRTRQEFVSNVSHEIRTPLAGVIGATDLALTHPLEPDVAELLQTSRLSARNLLFLLNDLLDLSKMDAGRFELEPVSCELEAELANVVRAIQPTAVEHGIALRVLIDGRLPERAMLDPLRLGQVLTNLLSNGIKFTGEGAVTLEVDCRPGGLTLRVRDTGRGIEASELERIFERFVQADGTSARREGGTGLGLSIVQQLVRRMDGELEVTSEVGRGSCFEVRLPLAVEPESEPVLAGVGVSLLGGESEERAAARATLERAGARVLAAGPTPEEAPADLLLALDADGLAAALELDGRPMVATVAAGDLPTRDRCTRLRKPLFPREVRAALASVRSVAGESPSRSALAGRRILVADDNRINRRIARVHLERWGCEVLEAGDGFEACAEIDRRRPDAVLMDVQMPGLDGIGATRRIREACSPGAGRLPIVALTANASREDRDACLAAGMDGHFTKPVEFAQLEVALVELIGRADRTVA